MRCELLEDRRLLTAYTVNSLADVIAADNAITLREALEAANTNTAVFDAPAGSSSVTDEISFDSNLFIGGEQTITLGGTQFEIHDEVDIQGPGADLLTIDADANSRLFEVFRFVALDLSDLTMTHGKAEGDGTVYSDDRGGAILADFYSTVTINGCVLSDNSAPRVVSGQLFYGSGGAIATSGTLEIIESTLENNSSSNSGGAIYVGGTNASTTIRNSVFSGNSAPGGGAIFNHERMTVENTLFIGNNDGTDNFGNGGAINNNGGSELDLVNCVFVGNSSDIGGVIYNSAEMEMINCTVTGNQSGHNSAIQGESTIKNSIISLNEGGDNPDIYDYDELTPESGNNLIGFDPRFVTNPNPGDDGIWGTEDDETDLHVQPGSAVIDSGDNGSIPAGIVSDFEGNPRITDGTVDIGAYEYSGLSVSAYDDAYDGLSADTTHILNVLSNDKWPPATVASVQIVEQPQWGSATVNPDGSVTYAPYYTFAREDTFSYELSVGSVSLGTATVSLRLFGDGPIIVSTVADESDDDYAPGDLSLREALLLAGAIAGNDTIIFDAGLNGQSLVLQHGQLVVDSDVEIQGPGAELLSIDGNDNSRLFNVPRYKWVGFSGLTLTGGRAEGDGTNLSDDWGGAIITDFYARITIADCVISGNSAPGSGYSAGGAISSLGYLTITDSTFENNSAINSGGAIFINTSSANTVIERTTFSGNSSADGAAIKNSGTMTAEDTSFIGNVGVGSGNGGAINNSGNGDLTLVNCTLSGNSAKFGAGVLNSGTLNIINSTIAHNNSSYSGGGIDGYGTTSLTNTIVANNTATTRGSDVDGTIISNGYNLIGDTNGSVGFGAVGDLLNADPRLGPLADNGGPTPTHALLWDSPALDAANTSLAPAADQRGITRPQSGDADIGAYEYEYISSDWITVSTSVDELDTDHSIGDLSLREALLIAAEQPGMDLIKFDSSLNGQSIVLQLGQVTIDQDVDIQGPGADLLTIDANQQSRVFNVVRYADVSFSGLTMTGGQVSKYPDNDGAAIDIDFYTSVQLSGVTISGNSANGTAGSGGAINNCGALTILDSVLKNNHADHAGSAIYIGGSGATTTIRNSIISRNTGVAIYNHHEMTIEDTMFIGNSQGGAINNNGGGDIDLVNCVFLGNSSSGSGAIYNHEKLDMRNCTIVGNQSGSYGAIAGLNGELTIANSIVALNEGEYPNLNATTTAESGCNLIDIDPRFVSNPNQGDDGIWGTEDDEIDLSLQPTSPAIDMGDNSKLPAGIVADIGGDTRIVKGQVDIGAREFQGTLPGGRETASTVVTTPDDTMDLYDDVVSLREAMLYASHTDLESIVSFSDTLDNGRVMLDGALITDSPLRIDASSSESITIDADAKSRVFTILCAGDVELVGLTITGGSAESGGGILNYSKLSLIDSTITENVITSTGGNGGGIYNKNVLLAVNSSISNNRIIEGYGDGAGIFTAYGTTSIVDSIVSGNVATGPYSVGGGICNDRGTLNIVNSIVSANTAAHRGGGIENGGPLTIINSTISNNSADDGSGIYSHTWNSVTKEYEPREFDITNSILALNSSDQYYGLLSSASSHNLIGIDPLFVRNPSDGGDGWGDNPATTGIDESANDDFGDLRLTLSSPAINAGENALALDPDGNPLLTDIMGNPRMIYQVVDIGAFEFSGSGDVNRDGKVDVADLGILATNYGNGSGFEWGDGDFNGDGMVDVSDLGDLATNYGTDVFSVNNMPGDANGDGNVDVSDLGILATNYGTSSGAEWGDGDFNDDGAVDVSDLGTLATNYGTVAVRTSATSATISGMPESSNAGTTDNGQPAGIAPATAASVVAESIDEKVADDDIAILAHQWMIAAEEMDDDDERDAVFAEVGVTDDMLGLFEG